MPAHAQRMSSLLAMASDKEFADCRVEGRAHAMQGESVCGDGSASGVHGEGPTQGLGVRARAERTWNMPCMFVTPEVSQSEMSALKFGKL